MCMRFLELILVTVWYANNCAELRSIKASLSTIGYPRACVHSFAPSPVRILTHITLNDSSPLHSYFKNDTYMGGILPSDNNPCSASTTIRNAVLIGFLMPLTAPTAPKVPSLPDIKLASHSTVPDSVKFEP